MTHASSALAIKRLSKQKPIVDDWARMTHANIPMGHYPASLTVEKGFILLNIFDYQGGNSGGSNFNHDGKRFCSGLKVLQFFELRNLSSVLSSEQFGRELVKNIKCIKEMLKWGVTVSAWHQQFLRLESALSLKCCFFAHY